MKETDLNSPENLDEEFLNVDPLEDVYRKSISQADAVTRSVKVGNTGLMVIDLQYLDAAEGHGVFKELNALPQESFEYYFHRLHTTVLPNVRRLQDCFRQHSLEIIHTRIQSLTQDGRDRSSGHKRLGLHAPPGSKDAEFLPQVAPQGDEIVINKSASGVFNATNVEYILRNIGVSGLFVAGVYTNECVSTTVRDACDRGFYTTLIRDACATVTPALEDASERTLKDRYCRFLNTDEAIAEIEALVKV